MVGLVAEPFMRSLRLLKYARIRLPIVEVRTKRHYELEAIKVDNNGEYSGKLVAKELETKGDVGKDSSSSLIGHQTKLPPNASAENIRSLVRENESAQILAKNGYHVEQNPITFGAKNPDYKINGEIFDNIAPKTSSVRNIYDRTLEKVSSGQTNNVVINLADTKVSIGDLQKQFNDWSMKGLDKVIVIDQSGKPIRIK